MTFNYQLLPQVKSSFSKPSCSKSKNSSVLFPAVYHLAYLSVFLQLVKLAGFLHFMEKVVADQAFLNRKGEERKVRLEECSHTEHCRSRMNVQKSVEILGEAAGSEFDGLVGQLPVGADRMVTCERWGRVNSFNEQSSHQHCKTPACVCLCLQLVPPVEWGNN